MEQTARKRKILLADRLEAQGAIAGWPSGHVVVGQCEAHNVSTQHEPAQLYERVRRSEGRLLDDTVVAGLPASGDGTPQASEWRIRERTLRRALRMLGDRPRTLLEVGCGNGWFSARLAEAGHIVTGLDTGATELEQARRVFAHLPITWVQADPWCKALPAGAFDTIVFAASIQYFPDLRSLLVRCRELLKQHGEILIVDSPFYTNDAAAGEAHDRSAAYYGSVSVPEMAAHYHHHTRQAIISAAPGTEVEFTPPRGRLVAALAGRYPFPIVRIRY